MLIQANGLAFAYLELGTGPLVLMVHGFPDTAYTWEHAMPAVAALGYRVVAPFTRGYFPTQVPEDGAYDVETLGRDLLALIEALGERSAIVIGHDWGAVASFIAAALAPERVSLLVTVGVPHPRSMKPWPRIIWAARHFFPLGRKHAAAKIRRAEYLYIDRLVRRWSPAWTDLPASETARVKAAFAQPGCLEAACAYYAAFTPRLPPSLRVPISVPAVSMAGLHDVLKPRDHERARSCYASSYTIVEVPGGHFLQREHPEAFNAALVGTLREHPPRAS